MTRPDPVIIHTRLERAKRLAIAFFIVSLVSMLTLSVLENRFNPIDGRPTVIQACVYLFFTSVPFALIILSFLGCFLWFQRQRQDTQRQLNEYGTPELIEITLSLPAGETRSTVAELVWMRAVFNADKMARAFLIGDEWNRKPANGPTEFDHLWATFRARRARPTMTLLVLVWASVAISLVCWPMNELIRIGFWTPATSSVKALLGLGSKAYFFGVLGWCTRGPHYDEERLVAADLVDRWLNGSVSAHLVMRNRACNHPEFREIAERCGWQVKQSV